MITLNAEQMENVKEFIESVHATCKDEHEGEYLRFTKGPDGEWLICEMNCKNYVFHLVVDEKTPDEDVDYMITPQAFLTAKQLVDTLTLESENRLESECAVNAKRIILESESEGVRLWRETINGKRQWCVVSYPDGTPNALQSAKSEE